MKRLLIVARDLEPGYFSLVMATGIVSLACYTWGWEIAAHVMGAINIGSYLFLWALTLLRIRYFFRHFWQDLATHTKGPGFFTLVAGTGVLANQAGTLWDAWILALGLWLLAAVLWLALCCIFFPLVAVKSHKSQLSEQINGLWLVIIVATQSLSLVASTLANNLPLEHKEHWLLGATVFHFLGGMLYLVIMPVLFQRFFFEPLSLREIDPPYWVNMGVEAISAFAGVRLLSVGSTFAFVETMGGAISMTTLAYWALSSWWLPILFILGFWRHVLARLPIRYQPGYWGMVFPLGMYCTATYFVALEFDIPLLWISGFMLPVAILAWGLTFLGLILRLRRAYR